MLLTILAFAFLQTQLPTPEQLLARHVEAAGGRAALEKIDTVIRKGCFKPSLGAPCLPAETYARALGKWQLRLTVPNVRMFEQGSDGLKAWAHDEDEATDLPAAERRQLDYGLDLRLPLRAAHYFAEMKTVGDRKVQATPRDGGKAIELEFDPSTGLLARAGDVGFEDYRVVGGVQIPHTILFYEGNHSSRITFSEVKVNAAAEDWRFDRQASAAAFRRDTDAVWLPQVEEALKGIDAGTARPMFNQLRSFPPRDGRILYDAIVQHGYKRGIEVGTARGNSALWMALALKKTGGKLITIEMDAALAKSARENFEKAGLSDVVECRNNDAFKEIPALEGRFDFLFLDTGTSMHKKFMELVYPARLAPGGAILSHNANSFAQVQPDFLKALTEDPKLDTKITNTPGGGVSVSVLK